MKDYLQETLSSQLRPGQTSHFLYLPGAKQHAEDLLPKNIHRASALGPEEKVKLKRDINLPISFLSLK